MKGCASLGELLYRLGELLYRLGELQYRLGELLSKAESVWVSYCIGCVSYCERLGQTG